MFLFDCFAQRLKHITISNGFEFLLDSLLSCREQYPHPPFGAVSASVTFG